MVDPLVPLVPLHAFDAAHEVACVEFHVSVDDPPDAMLEGDAEIFTVGWAPPQFEVQPVTVTVAEAEALPPAPVQVSVYVAFDPGVTVVDPLVASPPLQPFDAVQDVAWVELHVSVDDPPDAMLVGDAEIFTVGWGCGLPDAVTVTVMARVVASCDELCPGVEFPVNLTVPEYVPGESVEGLTETVALSLAYPDPPFVTPEGLEAGETESQPPVDCALAVHVSVEPGAPVLLTVTCWFTTLPCDGAVGDHDVGFTPIFATGFQKMIKEIAPPGGRY